MLGRVREKRESPDGDSVAIRSDFPVDGPTAWGVFNALSGGTWATDEAVAQWAPLTAAPSPPPGTP